jgi:Spy/CpxP family protein refolding chaperone
MRKLFFALLASGITLTSVKMLQAQPDPSPGKRQEITHKKIFEKLDLTDSQKKQLRDIRTAMQKNAVQLKSKVSIARIDLRELLTADEPDKGAIEKKLNEIGQLQTNQKLLRINHLLDMRKVLTPEQLKIWKSTNHGMRFDGHRMREKHPRMMMERREFMDNRGGMIENRPETTEQSLSMMGDDLDLMDESPGFLDEDHTMMDDSPVWMEGDGE